jgi:hypothetical protein
VERVDDPAEQRVVYRRRYFEDTWHFSHDCSGWPVENFQEQSAEPASANLCAECAAKNADRDSPLAGDQQGA